MANFVYPTSAQLKEIEQDLLPRLEADRPVFAFCPIVDEDAYVLMWEQRDNYTGLQQIRGLNGEFPRVKKTAINRYTMEPGVYGEFEPIDEAALTMHRRVGTFADPVDISDLVMPIQDKLLQRRLDRIESSIWTMLATGTLTVPGPNGTNLYADSYTLQTFSAVVPWATHATATPAADFRAVQILGRGHSVDFGSKAQAFMNQATFNDLALNTNSQDLYGRRVSGLATPNNLADINALLQGDNLPQIVIYDRGWLTDGPAGGPFPFNLYIPNNKVIVIGVRPAGQPVADYAMTRNANNPDLGPGAYMEVVDSIQNQGKPPRQLEVYDGHNGGQRIYWPSAIVTMSV